MSEKWLLANLARTVSGKALSRWGESSITTYERDWNERVLRDLEVGCLCVDKSALVGTPAFTSAVCRAPLASLKANPRPFNPDDVSPLMAAAVAGNEYGAILAGHSAGLFNLDECGLEEYADYWRSNGARIGRFDGARIVWEDES